MSPTAPIPLPISSLIVTQREILGKCTFRPISRQHRGVFICGVPCCHWTRNRFQNGTWLVLDPLGVGTANVGATVEMPSTVFEKSRVVTRCLPLSDPFLCFPFLRDVPIHWQQNAMLPNLNHNMVPNNVSSTTHVRCYQCKESSDQFTAASDRGAEQEQKTRPQWIQ